MDQIVTFSNSNYSIKQNGNIIQASGLKINQLDEISPKHAQTVLILNLSHNMISRIENMCKFTSLRELDISFNCFTNADELIQLSALQKLNKINVKGNPFLKGQFSEEIFLFLFVRETDVDLLGDGTLNIMKHLQLRIIFLKNYLRKKNFHHEMLFRSGQPNLTSFSEKLCILYKIIPQFYWIIQHQKFQTLIKKQAVALEKQQKLTLYEAMTNLKNRKQNQMEYLIRQLEKQLMNEFATSRKMKQSSLRQKISTSSVIIEEEIMGQNISDEQQLVSVIPRSLQQKLSSYYPRQSQQLQQQKPRHQYKTPSHRQYLHQIKNNEQYKSSNKQILTAPKNKQNKYLSSENELQIDDLTNKILKIPKSRLKRLYTRFENNKKKRWSDDFAQSLAHQQKFKFTQQFGNSIQYHPVVVDINTSQFNEQNCSYITPLLDRFDSSSISLSSLSDQKKSIIVQNLVNDHKQTTVQLYLQQQKSRLLNELIKKNSSNYQKQITGLLTKIQDKTQLNNETNKDYTQIQEDNITLNELSKELSKDIKNYSKQKIEHERQMQNKNAIIKSLQDNIKLKTQYITYLQRCQQLGEIISKSSQNNYKIQFINIIKERTNQYMRVINFKLKRQKQKQNMLTNRSLLQWKKYVSVAQLCKRKLLEGKNKLMEVYFRNWKIYNVKEKEIKGKENVLKEILNNTYSKFFVNFIINQIQIKKINKEKEICADRKLLFNQFAKFKKGICLSQCQQKQKEGTAENHKLNWIKKWVFYQLNNGVFDSKQKIMQLKIFIEQQWKSQFYSKWQHFHNLKLLKTQQKIKIFSLQKLVSFQLQYKQKNKAVKAILISCKQIYEKVKKIRKMKLSKTIIAVKNVIVNKRFNDNNKKIKQKIVKKYYGIFFKKLTKYQKTMIHLKKLFKKYEKCNCQYELIIEKKSFNLQEKLKKKYCHSVFYKLFRNLYFRKFIDYKTIKSIEVQQSNKQIQYIKNIQLVEKQTVKAVHCKQLQILKQQQDRKKEQYKKSLMKIGTSNKQLQNIINLIKNQLQWLKDKETTFFLQKETMKQQLYCKEGQFNQAMALNNGLKMEITEVTQKYDQTIKLYAHALIKMGKKEKIKKILASPLKAITKIKQKIDKTVEKLRKNNHFVEQQ